MFIQATTGTLLFAAVLFAPLSATQLRACCKPEPQPQQIEVSGKLSTGIIAIGGETTGTIVTAGERSWELDLGGDAALLAAAKKLNGREVVVRGTLTVVAGVEVPERRIIRVAELKPAK